MTRAMIFLTVILGAMFAATQIPEILDMGVFGGVAWTVTKLHMLDKRLAVVETILELRKRK